MPRPEGGRAQVGTGRGEAACRRDTTRRRRELISPRAYGTQGLRGQHTVRQLAGIALVVRLRCSGFQHFTSVSSLSLPPYTPYRGSAYHTAYRRTAQARAHGSLST